MYLEFLRIFNRGYEKGEVAGMRKALLQIMEQRFGPLPEPVLYQVEEISAKSKVERLLQRALKAKSLSDLRIGQPPRKPRVSTLG